MEDVTRTELNLDGAPWEEKGFLFLEVHVLQDEYHAIFFRESGAEIERALSDDGLNWTLSLKSSVSSGAPMAASLHRSDHSWLLWALADDTLWLGEQKESGEWAWTDVGPPAGYHSERKSPAFGRKWPFQSPCRDGSHACWPSPVSDVVRRNPSRSKWNTGWRYWVCRKLGWVSVGEKSQWCHTLQCRLWREGPVHCGTGQ